MTKPRVLFVSRERFRLPLDETQTRKWDALGDVLDYRVVAAAQEGSPTRTERFGLAPPAPALDGALYYARLPLRIARELRAFRPEVAVVQGVHEANAFLAARALARTNTRLALDIHGDWHAATRLYGSRARRLLDPLGDFMGVVAVRRADAIRTVSPFTSAAVRRLGREPTAEFPAFLDGAVFLARPPAALPERPRALFVGVLERYKGFDTLVEAWPLVTAVVPDAELHVIGRGTLSHLARGLEWTQSVDAAGVASALDGAWLLCLPSRAEGFGRVVVEAMCRGRAVVGGDAGGIPDLVEDEADGVLVPPGDPDRLADALVRILGNRGEAERLGVAARRRGEALTPPPEEYAERVRRLVACASRSSRS